MKLSGAVWIVAFLLWLPFEDTQIWLAFLLALAAVSWLALRMQPWHSATWRQAALRGALLGTALPVFAITLMAFKSGLHGHGFADFSSRQVWGVITALPISLVLGLSISIGARAFAVDRGL